MDFGINKYISPFIESQFPAFYQSEGPNLILFFKAYYEWMEQDGNPIGEARNLLDYRDIDNTLDQFITHFQQKYLEGIPLDTVVNKKYLVKHILDVYRSKGTINGYKLLFKLLYNEDIEIYLPGEDILKASDGIWIQPKYIEVTDNGNLEAFVGQNIIGIDSGVNAIVESFIKENTDSGIVNSLYLSNISPQSKSFNEGEKITIFGSDPNIIQAPSIVGSAVKVSIFNGGQNFKVGNILKIVQFDPTTGKKMSFGSGALVKIASLTSSFGSLNFNIINGGFGFLANAETFVYNGIGDSTGKNGSFSIGALTNEEIISYNTDLLCNYANTLLGANSYGFPANSSANMSSIIGSTLSITNGVFGTVTTLTKMNGGNTYTQPPFIYVRSTIQSQNLVGTVYYSNTSPTITGNNTLFLTQFSSNDEIVLLANSSTQEKQIVKTVNSNTSLTLYGNPTHSANNTNYAIAPIILTSNYLPTDPIMIRSDGTQNGNNCIITGYDTQGNNVVNSVTIISSGKGYIDGENIVAYLYNALTIPTILAGGVNYANGDTLIFSGGGTNSLANGYVITDSNGSVTQTILTYAGSGFIQAPTITVKTGKGKGAVLTVSTTEYNLSSQIQGKIVKGAIGISPGYFNSTRGFLNSDKYVQDSYFYQDYSYQIKTSQTLEQYKNVIYNTFHPTSTELFGEYVLTDTNSSSSNVLYTSNTVILF